IHDFAVAQNAFAGAAWSYILDTNVVEDAVVINEIMYHPSLHLASEAYIELFNKGSNAINLTGWEFTAGVDFNFPAISIPAASYLVVAANPAAFHTKYPAV